MPLDDESKALLDTFSAAANKDHLHPMDWQRFYSFVVDAHVRRVDAADRDVSSALWAQRFTEPQAVKLGSIYDHGREVLKLYDEQLAARGRG
jgi:hypothetical protein